MHIFVWIVVRGHNSFDVLVRKKKHIRNKGIDKSNRHT